MAAVLLAGCGSSEEDPGQEPSPSATSTVEVSPNAPATTAPASPGRAPSGGATGGPGSQPSGTGSSSATAPAPSSTTRSPGGTGGSDETEPPPDQVIIGTADEALAAWFASRGLEYAGPCEQATVDDDTGKYCSRVVEDRETAILVMVGPTFAEFTEYVLIQRTDQGWIVARVAEVPAVGEDSDDSGLPF
jgi:hypothetical protein